MSISYVLVTAARNEEDFIEETITAVISQALKPIRWVIVNDGSTDRTKEIVDRYTKKYDFIQLLDIEGHRNRNFASKVAAINRGLKLLEKIEYQFIGNIDADIGFGMDYFDKLLEKFKANDHLGIAGGWIHELKNHRYKERFGNTNQSVPGAIQMFKRECFETINGYIPLIRGGEEYVAEVMARLQGWEAKSFPDLKVFHRRRTGTENGNILYRRYNMGIEDYFIGYHPLFEILKIIRRIKEEPYFIGSIFRMIGYLNGFLGRRPILLPYELIKAIRKEQMRRISSFLKI